MPEENIQLARAGIEAFNARDVERLVELAHPDSEWFPFRAQLEGGSYRGHEGVRRFITDMADDWKEFRIDLTELSEAGDDRVVVIGEVNAVARGSGVAVRNEAGFVLDYRDGLLRRLVSYSDPDEARRAAG